MTQLSNQFSQTTEKGILSPSFGGVEASYNTRIVTGEASPIVTAQAVKLSDTAGSDIVVTAVTNISDAVFGFVPNSVEKDSYDALDTVKVATDGSVMIMEAGAAIARGASLELVLSGQKVVTQATGTVIGTCLDKATASGDLVRVAIRTIG